MEEPKASGRIICSSSSVTHWSEIIEMLRPKYPFYPFETKCGSEQGRDMPHSLDTTKIHELGIESFKSLGEMFDDCIKCFQYVFSSTYFSSISASSTKRNSFLGAKFPLCVGM